MSISLVYEVQNELRRLFIAGSELAVDDFRLKKLLPQMKKSGEKVPVFARVADSIEKLVMPTEESTSLKLLELSNIVNAIIYTQGQTGAEGEIQDIVTSDLTFSTRIPFRKLHPVIDALTSSGSGRLEVIREALTDGIFKDLRLVSPLVNALNDGYAEIADLSCKLLEGYGKDILDIVKKSIDFNGGKGEGRKIELVSKIAGKDEKEFYLEAVEKGSADVKISSAKALKYCPECEDILLELSKDKKKEIREAALSSLAYLGTDSAIDRIIDAFKGKDRSLAIVPVKQITSKKVSDFLVGEAEEVLSAVLQYEALSEISKEEEKKLMGKIENLCCILGCMDGKKEEGVFEFLRDSMEHAKYLSTLKTSIYSTDNTVARTIANNILSLGTKEAFEFLESISGKYRNLMAYSFEAVLCSNTPEYLFDNYSKYLTMGKRLTEGKEILRVMHRYIKFSPQYRTRYDYSEGWVYGDEDMIESEYTWDTRWLKILIDIDELDLVCMLASDNNPQCIDYLLKKLRLDLNLRNDNVEKIFLGLMQANYSGIIDAVTEVLDYNFNNNKKVYMTYYINRFARVLNLLPSECAEDIKNLALKYDNEDAKRLHEVVFYLEEKGRKV